MTRTLHLTGAVLAIAVLTPWAGWSQEAGTAEEPEATADAPAAEDEAAAADPAAGAAAEAGTESDGAGAEEPGADAEDPAGEATGAGDARFAVAYEEDGRYFTAEDTPTFNIAEDGTVDWLTYSGFRRYHAECHVCHGPDGEGSSYAPALKDSVLKLDYYAFYDVVVNGRQGSHNSVMPSFGDNANVMCYLDDIYVYLLARGAGDLPRGRPAGREEKSEAIAEAENACLGT